MCDIPRCACHQHPENDKMEDNEAETCNEPFKQERPQREAFRLAQATQKGAKDQECDVYGSQAWVISVPLIFDLLRSLGMNVELLW